MDRVEQIFSLVETRGFTAYVGEATSVRDHLLHAAHLAVRDEASDALIAAALLHDIGHLFSPDDDPATRGVDGAHEQTGADWLGRHFGPAISEPVRFHVVAKRYLCAVDPTYKRLLSAASVRSLQLQGGPLAADEISTFESNAFHKSAVALRRWDDRAKISKLVVPPLQDYELLLRRV